ncbi:MAG TPA: hypothetical protein VIL30_21690 [Ramlibacter sp.]|jgi:hypothetical protein
MTHPALQRIESGMEGAHAALLQGEMAQMHTHLVHALDGLAEVTRDGMVPVQERRDRPWSPDAAARLMWQLLARLKAEQCHVFPYAGTLLGLERDGQLLPADKDIDLGVWLEDFALAGRLLQGFGLQRATDVPPFGNMGTWVEPASGLSVDLFGLLRDPVRERVQGGVWLYGRPPEWQRVVVLPPFELAERAGPSGPVWWPDPVDAILKASYGDWHTAKPEWDTRVSNRAVQDLNLSWHCWALKSLCDRWLTGDLASTLRLLEQIAMRCGDSAQLRAWREALASDTPR